MRISKGTGDYPWGFRIQFSKPIVVTEVDTSECRQQTHANHARTHALA